RALTQPCAGLAVRRSLPGGAHGTLYHGPWLTCAHTNASVGSRTDAWSTGRRAVRSVLMTSAPVIPDRSPISRAISRARAAPGSAVPRRCWSCARPHTPADARRGLPRDHVVPFGGGLTAPMGSRRPAADAAEFFRAFRGRMRDG